MQSNNKKTIEDVLEEIGYQECRFQISALEVENFASILDYGVRNNASVEAVIDEALDISKGCLHYEKIKYYFGISLDDDEEIDLFVGSLFQNSLLKSFITKHYSMKVILCICADRYYSGYEEYSARKYWVYFFDKEKFEEKCKEYNIDLKMR